MDIGPILTLLVIAGLLIATPIIASFKNRSFALWFFFAFFVPIIPFIIILFLHPFEPQQQNEDVNKRIKELRNIKRISKTEKRKRLFIVFISIVFFMLIIITSNYLFNAKNKYVNDYKIYDIKNVGHISIPSIMEIQSGQYNKLSKNIENKINKNYDYEEAADRIVFQQKGLNKLDTIGFDTYVRVIIWTDIGFPGEYNKISSSIELSKSEIDKLSKDFRKQNESLLKSSGHEILEWNAVKQVRINNWSALEISYLRQFGKNTPVIVIVYLIPNYDRMHTLTTSYKQSDEKTWEPLLEKIVSSFTITNIR